MFFGGGAAELFIHNGVVKQGFFVGLTDLFGDGAFAKDGHRFATFLQSAVPYARALELERAWGGERSRLGLDNWDPAMPLPKGPVGGWGFPVGCFPPCGVSPRGVWGLPPSGSFVARCC